MLYLKNNPLEFKKIEIMWNKLFAPAQKQILKSIIVRKMERFTYMWRISTVSFALLYFVS